MGTPASPFFDGTHCSSTPTRAGLPSDWKTFIFNYGRSEVGASLCRRMFWPGQIHATGLRLMLSPPRLYSITRARRVNGSPTSSVTREPGAIDFLRRFNHLELTKEHPTFKPTRKSRPPYPMVRGDLFGGLGFGLKWDMAGMTHASVFQPDRFIDIHHNKLTFRHDCNFISRKFRPAAEHERGRSTERLLDRQNARATSGRNSPTCGCCSPHVCRNREENCSYGRRFGQGQRVLSHDRSLDWKCCSFRCIVAS